MTIWIKEKHMVGGYGEDITWLLADLWLDKSYLWILTPFCPQFCLLFFLSLSLCLSLSLSWSIVDLQCYDQFQSTAQWFSYTYTHIHSFFKLFPIYIITECWVQFPVLYSRSSLANHSTYLSVHMSIPRPHPSLPPPW